MKKKIRYYVYGLAYDNEDRITDHEIYFGDFATLPEARERFNETVERFTEDQTGLFHGFPDTIAGWTIQIEKCECQDGYNECIDTFGECFIKKK